MLGFQFRNWTVVTVKLVVEKDVASESHVAPVGICCRVQGEGKHIDDWMGTQLVLPVAAWTAPVATLNA